MNIYGLTIPKVSNQIIFLPDAKLCDGLLVLLAAGAELLLDGEGQRLPGHLLPDEGLYL